MSTPFPTYVNGLPPATTVNPGDLCYLLQGGVSKQAAISSFSGKLLAPGNLNFYVSTTGSDSNSGAIGSPFQTIAHAISVAEAYDWQFQFAPTINVAAGIYDVRSYPGNGLILPELTNIANGSNDTTGGGVIVGALSAVVTFTGYIAGTTLTISAITGTPLGFGQILSGAGITAGTVIIALLAGGGGAGSTFSVSVSQTVGSVGSPVTITASTLATTIKTVGNVSSAAVFASGGQSIWTFNNIQWDHGFTSTVGLLYTQNGAAINCIGNHELINSAGGANAAVITNCFGGTINWHAVMAFNTDFDTFFLGGGYGNINVGSNAYFVFSSAVIGYFWADCQTGPMFISDGTGTANYPNVSQFAGDKYIISGFGIVISTPSGTLDAWPGLYRTAYAQNDAQTFISNNAAYGGLMLMRLNKPPLDTSVNTAVIKNTTAFWKDVTNGGRFVVFNDAGTYYTRQIGRNINARSSSYTLALGDDDGRVEMNIAGANTLTVPPSSNVAFTIGTEIRITQIGAGATTITPGSAVTVDNAGALSQWQTVVLYKRGTNEWVQTGA
jgi:hypothetical protein